MRLRTALAAVALGLSAPAFGQSDVSFTIDQPTSQWTWSGTTSLGPLLGNPSNQFALSGDQRMSLERGANPISELRLLPGGVALVVPDIAARIPNPVPLFPDLATIDIQGLSLQFTTPMDTVVGAGGAFSASVITTALSGSVVVTPLIGSTSTLPLAGLVSDPIVVTGSLVQTGSSLRLVSNIAGSFDFSDPASGITATIDLTGILGADWDCPTPVNYCMANPNSTGGIGMIAAGGSTRIQDNSFELIGSGLPNNQFAYFLGSRTEAFTPNPGGSQGNLCLGGNLGRFNAQVGQVAGGQFSIPVNLDAIPVSPAAAVQPGETWSFQLWYRDANPGATSNFTNGLRVVFCP